MPQVRRHITAQEETDLTLLAVVGGGKHVGVDPASHSMPLDSRCRECFEVILDTIGPVTEMIGPVTEIKVVETDAFGMLSLVIPACAHVRAHQLHLARHLAEQLQVDVSVTFDEDGVLIRSFLEPLDGERRPISIVRTCLNGLVRGWEKVITKQFHVASPESHHVEEMVCIAALVNPAASRDAFTPSQFELGLRGLWAAVEKASRGARRTSQVVAALPRCDLLSVTPRPARGGAVRRCRDGPAASGRRSHQVSHDGSHATADHG